MRPSAPERDDGSLLSGMLRSVTNFVSQFSTLTLWCVAIISLVSIGLTVRYIGFKTQRADLIDPRADFQQRWMEYTESFGDASDIVVVVEADSPGLIKQVLEDLGSRLELETDYFSQVLYKIDPGRMRGTGLQFFSPTQLEAGLRRLDEYGPVLRGRWDLLRLESLISRLHYQIQSRQIQSRQIQSRQIQSRQTQSNQIPSRSENGSADALTPLLEHAELLSISMAAHLENRSDFRSPWPELLPWNRKVRETGNEVIYFLNDRGSLGFLKAFPAGKSDGFEGAAESIGRLRDLIAEVSPNYPQASIGVTGIPVLENDEMRRSQSDMMLASVMSFVGVGLLLFLGFRGFRHPLLALLMLAVGMAWAFGYTTLAIGHLNILSISFAAILIGLGIDFAIHYLARYLELRHEGESLRPALTKTSTSVGTGIVTAAVTTALAFFCATFTEFLGVAELGVIAGGGILLCALATFVVLPALISLSDRDLEPRKLPTPFEANGLRRITARVPLLVMITSLIVVVGIGLQAQQINDGRIESKIKYDYNLLNLQAKGLESVEVQKRIFQEAHDSLLFAVSIADSAKQARELRKKFEALPTVHHVEDLASRLPAYSPQQTGLLVQSFRAQLAGLPRELPRVRSPDPATVGRNLEQLYLQVRKSRHPTAQRITEILDGFLDRFEQLSLSEQTRYLKSFQQRTVAAILRQFQSLAAASNSRPVLLSDIPEELTSRFLSPEGKWLIQIFPKEQIWDVEPLTRFVDDVRTVDANVTGTPLQNFEAAQQIKTSYEDASLYALSVICIVLLVDFLGREHKLLTMVPPLVVVLFAAVTYQARRTEIDYVLLATAYVGMAAAIAAFLDFRHLRDALLAMLPPIAGGLLMFGVLGILGVDLNPANLIVLPLVLGIGVDDGVHVVHDFRMQKSQYRTSSSTINAIVLTSLTSMIGFGSMMLAAHRGLYSVGLVLVVGVGSCLFVSLVTLPAILTLISKRTAHGDEAHHEQDSLTTKHSSKREKIRAA